MLTTRRKVLLGISASVVAIATPTLFFLKKQRDKVLSFFGGYNSEKLSPGLGQKILSKNVTDADRSRLLFEVIMPNREKVIDDTQVPIGECGAFQVRDERQT